MLCVRPFEAAKPKNKTIAAAFFAVRIRRWRKGIASFRDPVLVLTPDAKLLIHFGVKATVLSRVWRQSVRESPSPYVARSLTAAGTVLYLTTWLSIAAPRLTAPLPRLPIRQGGRWWRVLPTSPDFR